MSALATEWRTFRADAPGERFGHHYDRAQQASRAKRIGRLAVGIALLAIGIALLFLPGPGLLVALFGAAMLSSQSRRLARGLDRAELWARRIVRRIKSKSAQGRS